MDILYSRRLYCARLETLNDPLEAHCAYSYFSCDLDDVEARIETIRQAIGRKRVCSLSRSLRSHLLWAHYASGFRGVALEVHIPDACIEPIQYRPQWYEVKMDDDTDLEQVARSICFSKIVDWTHEDEVRVLSEDEFFPLPDGVSKIICGPRMDSALQSAFRAISTDLQIPIRKMVTTDEGFMEHDL